VQGQGHCQARRGRAGRSAPLTMPKLDWRTFHEARPISHRVCLVVLKDADGSAVVPLRDVQGAVARLLNRLGAIGSFALATSRESGDQEILGAFTEQRDAYMLTAALSGQRGAPAQGHRQITVGEQQFEEILVRAGKPNRKHRPRQRPSWPDGL
jgi:hypothetical protein